MVSAIRDRFKVATEQPLQVLGKLFYDWRFSGHDHFGVQTVVSFNVTDPISRKEDRNPFNPVSAVSAAKLKVELVIRSNAVTGGKLQRLCSGLNAAFVLFGGRAAIRAIDTHV